MVAANDMVVAAVAVLGMSTLVAPSPMPRPAKEQEQVVSTGVGVVPLAYPFRHGGFSYSAPVRRRFMTAEESRSLCPRLEEPKNDGTNVTRPLGGWGQRKGPAERGEDMGVVGRTGKDGIERSDADYENICSGGDGEVSDEYEEEGITEDPDGDNADGENTSEENEGW